MARPLVAVLAAGRGRRFGGGKLETDCAGKPLGRWVIEAVEQAGLEPGLIVTGPEGVSFAAGWRALVNREPEAGLGSSLALAARAAFEAGDEALLVLLADMPLIDPDFLRGLASAPAPAATRQDDGRPGVPALLDRTLIAQAMALSGDRGAGPLLTGASLWEAPPGALLDVDTVEGLAKVARVLRPRPAP
ncbi:NTP transferase domain-containing protein [Croceibacterium sp. LX-88]|jgi:CTP:molybdopterin cytidylyltransferase MocA|uniref:NTP transferase domain-containing protein n=1 Tax=Croceibacterium selenioxidans TaxID=2838833 RepID=A0ABS5W164_9SPHN|nr:NTP transferase domain-containing protein [Croceibacterium selenioxidans]MBT2133057.1 NTP transferase domain-containing protein [Croceibacterium selenioxidans]